MQKSNINRHTSKTVEYNDAAGYHFARHSETPQAHLLERLQVGQLTHMQQHVDCVRCKH